EQNELYASTDEGIFKINPTITNCISTEKTATSFLIDEFGNFNLLHDGYFWIYKDCETKPNKWVAELDNLKAGYSLFEDNRERLWVGTEQGVFIYENLTVHNISEDNNLPSNLVNDITQDSLGDVWLATENGLAQLRADSIIRVFTVTDGLLSNQCRKICVNPFGGIWIATPRGLHFLFEDKIIPYNESTGLSSSDVNALFVDSNNHLWVATSNGIAKQKLIKNPILALSPRVDIQNFWSNDKPIELPNLPIIPFDNYIKIDFDAITFSNTNEIVFEYRLNKNKPWKPTQDRSLTLTDLREGEYEFQLRAKKINSEWSNIETFSFRIAPPFWRANWFLFLLFSTLVIFSVAVIIFFKKQEQQKTAFHQQLAELELNALQAQMNPHFIFNALNAIQDFVVRNDANEANKYLSKFSKLMRLFLESSKSKYITLAEEIRLLKLYISLEKLCYEEHFDYTFEVDETLDEDIEIPSMFIQPFVENAIRHGLFNKKEKGFLRLSFKEKNEQLVCEITDNGIGRAKAKKIATTKNKRHKSRGLEIISQRQAVFSNFNNETIQFSIKDLEDENGQANGTKVTIAFEIE
ncbi:MAG: histidine kinase, partial [Saprospiraceae bacterium]